MDDLNNLIGGDAESYPVDLTDLVQVNTLPENTAPISAIRNKAATTAMLNGNPEQAVDTYKALMSEGQEGGSQMINSLSQQNQSASTSKDLTAVYSLLADPKATLAQKQAVVKGFSQSDFLKDRSATLQSNMLSADNPGESQDAEAARISIADQLSKMYSFRGQLQGMVNDAVSKWPDRTILGAGVDAASQMVPFSNSVVTGKIEGALNPNRSILQVFKTFFTPGTTEQQMRDKLDSLPLEQKVEYAKQVVQAIQSNSSFLFGNDNQANAYDKLQTFAQDGHSYSQEFLNNLFPLLDTLGLHGLGSSAAKAAGGVASLLERRGANVSASGRVEPSFGPETYTGKAFNPKTAPKQQAEDVPFSETLRSDANGVSDVPFTETPRSTPQGVGPNRQIDSGIPKLTQEPTSLNNRRGLIGNKGEPPLLENPVKRLQAAQDKVDAEAAVVRSHPASPGELANHVNPTQARNMYDAATKQGVDEEVAKAFYNSTPDQVLLNEKAGQISGPGEAVITKVPDIDQLERVSTQPDSVTPVNLAYDSLGDMYTAAERVNIRSNVVNDFENALGMRPVDGMGGVKLDMDGRTLHISSVYESPTGSWSNAQDAVDAALYGLRGQGVLPSEVEVLMKDGLEHVPVDPASVQGVTGDFKVRVNVTRNAEASDVTSWDHLDVKRNVFDRIPQFVSDNRGSVNQWMLEAADMLHPTITGSAVNVDYQSTRLQKQLLSQLKKSADEFTKLDDARWNKVVDYLHEANNKEIDFDVTDLRARGFTPDEINGIREWRKFWDQHYQLENRDKALTLRARGYQVLDTGQDKFFAKPIAKDRNVRSFYDPTQGLVRGFTTGELDTLYQNGGTLGELVRPVDINGQTVEHIISRQSPQEYLRVMRDTDRVLNYKKGYFQRSYTAPRFIDEVERNAQGVVTKRKTVAVAGDTKTANDFSRRMAANNGKQYEVRGDIRELTDRFNSEWDLDSSSGRVAQRYRGKLLEDATSPNQLGNTFVENPLESALRSANSISNRTVSRPQIEATKQRFLDQYASVLPLEKGQTVYPTTIQQIGSVGKESTKLIADARSTWMMIRKLEQGYVNTLDQASKAIINSIADALGERGFAGTERALRKAGDKTLQGLSRKVTSDVYIALNPLRQVFVQAWQGVRVFSYNPIGTMTGKVPGYAGGYLLDKIVPGSASKEFKAFVDESGLIESVDRHTLINGAMMDMASTNSKWVKAGRLAYTPVEISRRIGFDAGETTNRIYHMAGVFDRYKRLGRDLTDKNVRAQAWSEASALMGDMTRAGEMPYNSSTVGAIFQFFQAPHKIMTQFLNRRVDPWSRARMAFGDFISFGLPPAGIIAGWLGIDKLTGDNTELKDFLDHGLISMQINHTINEIWADSGKIDLGSLDVRGYDGLIKLAQSVWTGTVMQQIANSPSGGFLTGTRTKDALKSMGRFFGVVPEWDQNNPTTFLGMLNDVASLTSGWSNYNKAKMIMSMNKRADAYGSTIDQNATTPQALAQLFGFGSQAQTQTFEVSKYLSEKEKSHKEDIIKTVQEVARYYTTHLEKGNTDIQWLTGVTGALMNHFADDPDALEEVNKQIGFMLEDKGSALTEQILRACDLPDAGAIHDQINKAPGITDANKQRLHQICSDMANVRNNLKKEK